MLPADAGSDHEGPGEPDEGEEAESHGGYSAPAAALVHAGGGAVAADVFGELGPVGLGDGAEGIFGEALHPEGLVETEETAVAAQDAAVEDSAGELGALLVFEGAEMADGDPCSGGDGFELNAACFSLLLQIGSETQVRLRCFQPASRPATPARVSYLC